MDPWRQQKGEADGENKHNKHWVIRFIGAADTKFPVYFSETFPAAMAHRGEHSHVWDKRCLIAFSSQAPAEKAYWGLLEESGSRFELEQVNFDWLVKQCTALSMDVKVVHEHGGSSLYTAFEDCCQEVRGAMDDMIQKS